MVPSSHAFAATVQAHVQHDKSTPQWQQPHRMDTGQLQKLTGPALEERKDTTKSVDVDPDPELCVFCVDVVPKLHLPTERMNYYWQIIIINDVWCFW